MVMKMEKKFAVGDAVIGKIKKKPNCSESDVQVVAPVTNVRFVLNGWTAQ